MLEDEILGNLYQKLPVTLEKGLGSHVWDIDGNEFIDCWLACLPITFGYRNRAINKAIQKQLKKGITFLPSCILA